MNGLLRGLRPTAGVRRRRGRTRSSCSRRRAFRSGPPNAIGGAEFFKTLDKLTPRRTRGGDRGRNPPRQHPRLPPHVPDDHGEGEGHGREGTHRGVRGDAGLPRGRQRRRLRSRADDADDRGPHRRRLRLRAADAQDRGRGLQGRDGEARTEAADRGPRVGRDVPASTTRSSRSSGAARNSANWSRGSRRTWSSRTGWPRSRTAWRSTAGTSSTASRSSRSRSSTSNWYVDYSHGVRLMKRTVTVDGKPRDVRHVLYAADLCGLLSDEGPITRPTY